MSPDGASMEGIGRRFVAAFNRRDGDDLVAMSSPAIEFHPTMLIGARRTYVGHAGLRQWIEELAQTPFRHQVRVREVRPLDARRFLLLADVLVDDEAVSPSAMVARLADDGRIVEAHAYLTDEEMLAQIGIVSR